MELKIIYLEYNDTIKEKNLVMCLGFFDGMHKAHKKLITEAVKIAKAKKLKTALFTFSMNVLNFIKNKDNQCLTTIEDKEQIAKDLGLDIIYVMKVSKGLVQMPAEEFIKRFLENTDTVVAGKDFRFGYKNQGDISLLTYNDNFYTIVIPEVKYLGNKISSSAIRESLKNGNIDLANHLLGRRYKITGEVVKGTQIGQKLGFPTANVDYTQYLMPKTGVYHTTVTVDGKKFIGATNVGNRPTFGKNLMTLETFIIGLEENIYGKTISVEFNSFIRPEKKYDDQTKLIEQIKNDIEIIKKANI